MGESSADRALLPLIGQFLEAQSFHHEHGGYLGLDADPIGEGFVRIGHHPGLLVFSSRVLCELPDHADTQLVPCLWFYVCRATGEDEGFVVAVTAMLDGLRNLHPTMGQLREKALPGFEGGEPGGHTMEVGVPLQLRLSLVAIEQPSDALYQYPSTGIRFALWRTDDGGQKAPFTHFTMAGINSLLALAVALDETPTEEPPTFADQLVELSHEIDSDSRNRREDGVEDGPE